MQALALAGVAGLLALLVWKLTHDPGGGIAAQLSQGKRPSAPNFTLPKLDDPVDRLNRLTHLEALKLADDPRALEWGLHMNLVARALERVGDNAVDIAEQVSFLITGEFREFTDASHEVQA